MQHSRTFTALLLAGVLLASIGMASAAFTPAFADTKSMGQHIPNSKDITIESVGIYLRKSTNTVGNAEISIVQAGKQLASVTLSTSHISGQYSFIVIRFDKTAEVDGQDFDVVVTYDGSGTIYAYKVADYTRKVPGNYFESTFELTGYDMKMSINGQSLSSGLPNGSTGSGGTGSSSGTGGTGSTGSTGGTTTTAGTVLLSLTSKRSEDGTTEIKGMHFAVWKGMVKIGDGFTGQQSVQVKAGETYDIYATLAYGQISFVKWADTQSTNNLRTEKITADKTFTVLYSGAPTTTTDGSGTTGGTSGTGGTTGTGDSGGTGSNGGTTTAGANQVAVNSQLLNGTPKTGMAVELREAVNGNIAQNSFTPATLNMKPGVEYKAIMYPFQDNFFRHWTDGGLHRYHLVDTAHNSGDTLTAQYEQVPTSQAAHLMVNAKTTSGQPIGGTTGSEEDLNLNAEPGLEVLVAPPGSMTAYTAGFTGGSEIADAFHFAKGKTYTVIAQEFGKYKFSHWDDNDSTNRARAVPLNGDLTLTAIYDVVS